MKRKKGTVRLCVCSCTYTHTHTYIHTYIHERMDLYHKQKVVANYIIVYIMTVRINFWLNMKI